MKILGIQNSTFKIEAITAYILRNSYDFSDLRMLIPKSKQQCGRGSMYSPMVEQVKDRPSL